MKIIYLIILLFAFTTGSLSQVYSGHVIDRRNQHPVPFANIGIPGKNTGTVSDSEGWFKIELNSDFDNDTLCISCIGFEQKKYSIRQLKSDTQNTRRLIIELIHKTYNLEEVHIKPTKTRIYTLGNYCDPNSAYGNAFYSKDLGTEVGVVIDLPRGYSKALLRSFRFFVGEFSFYRFPVRLNIYSIKNGLPDENLLNQTIFYEITSAGVNIINLEKYGIVIENNVFISLEYYRTIEKEDGKLIFCAVHNRKNYKGNGFYRLTSQGSWLPEYGDNVGFSVQAECKK
jgi:hypothetical protein